MLTAQTPKAPTLAARVAVGLALSLLVATLLPVTLEAQYYNSFGKNKIQYRDFDWQIYHSPHFDVYYYTEQDALLEKVVSFAESAYDELSQALDYQIQDPTPLIFYETHSAFEQNNIILNFIPEGVGAFASPVRYRMVLPVDMPDPELLGLIKHELTHIFQYYMLYQGSLAKGLANNAPLWLTEGMASYMAKDEQTTDRMFLRDMVVNDNIPPITQSNIGGFFAYRFGHAVFDFIEERWGQDGFLDFIYEFRNTIGSRVGRAVERTFKMDSEDFDREFRRWLRQKYLPQLVETGEPGDFGRPFRIEDAPYSSDISPVASPSGDLVAALSTYKAGQLDVILFDARKRRFLRNLTRGFETEYQYIAAKFVASPPGMGRDLTFSPDGNTLATFAKRERGRSLVLIDVIKGGIRQIIDLDVEQPFSPTWHPDGRTIAFGGNQNGSFDIFAIDLETLEVRNVTNDALYDAAPTFSPDGERLVYSSVVGDYAKLFSLEWGNPDRRFQLTYGDANDKDATFSSDGQTLYFASDRGNGIDNIYSLDLGEGDIRQYTDVVTGCFMPTVLSDNEGKDELVYVGYWKNRFELFVNELEEPVGEPTREELDTEPVTMADLPQFEPDIQVALDDANKEGYGGGKFFLENADAFIGVTDNQDFLGQVILTFSDYLGDRRIIGVFDSQNSLSNFDIYYLNLENRLQWQVHLFDDRYFYTTFDSRRNEINRSEEAYQLTGLEGSLIYPLSFNTRFEAGVGYIYRQFRFQVPNFNPDSGFLEFNFVDVEDDYPFVRTSLVHDNAVYAPYGPVSGNLIRADVSYAPDLDDSGTLTSYVALDARKYFSVSQRSNVALRLYAAAAEGNTPVILAIGGLDTLRGFEYRELTGDRVFFANIEYRFPLIDLLATPVLVFQGIRGRVFLDIGGAWYNDAEDFDFWNSDESRLEDALAAYGFGVSVNFLGLNLNWDFSKEWDFKDSGSSFRTDFYIGARF